MDPSQLFGLGSSPILFVVNLFHPVDHLAVQRFGDGDVGHGCAGGGAVPMLHARRNPHDIARLYFLGRLAPLLDHASPAVTISVCPSGCLCQAVRAPGAKMTIAPPTRTGSVPRNGESIRTAPVKYSAGPAAEGCVPMRVTFTVGVSAADDA